MILEFDPNIVVSWIATGLSILGNMYVIQLETERQKIGYYIWVVSNIIWVSYFLVSQQWAPFCLFAVYLMIAIAAIWKRSDIGCSEGYGAYA